jgi:hypothetical protein
MSSSFVASSKVASANSAARGRNTWKVGDKHWDLHVHHAKCLSRNLAAVVSTEEQTNAGTLGLRSPEAIFDMDAFVGEHLKAERSELVNRPDIGLSMLVGNLAALKTNLQEGVVHGFFGAAFVSDFVKIYDKFNLDMVNQTLNLQDFPDIDRSESTIKMAAVNLLKFGAAAKEMWPRLADFLGRCAGAYIGTFSILSVAGCLVPGKFAAGVAEVPLSSPLAEEARKKLLASPGAASAMADFWTAVTWGRLLQKKSKANAKQGVMPATSASATLSFTPTPKKVDKKKTVKLNKLVANFDYDVTAEGSSWEDIQEKAQELHELAFEISEQDPNFELEFDIKAKAKKLKAALKEHTQAAEPEIELPSQKRRRK